MPADKLSAKAVQNAKPRPRIYRLADGYGMYLEVRPGGKDGNGSKYWRMAYRFDDKQKQLALGVYPDVSLADAREARRNARELLRQGIDPSVAKRVVKVRSAISDRFDTVANAWYEQTRTGSKDRAPWSSRHANRVRNILDHDLFPMIGPSRVNEIKPKHIIEALERVEARGALQTLLKVRGVAEAVFTYAVGRGLAESNPARDVAPSAFKSRPVKHHAAITTPEGVAHLLRVIRGYSGHATVCCALRLLPLVFVRPGELRNAHWQEFDLEGATWEIPAGRMKQRQGHTVPLSRQAVEILRELHRSTGDGNFCFPGVRHRDKPISDNTINAALRGLGFDQNSMTGHGFRAMARTLLDERLRERVDLIEHQLAHQVRDPLGRAYNRTAFLEERREMMQRWADYLDKLATDGS